NRPIVAACRTAWPSHVAGVAPGTGMCGLSGFLSLDQRRADPDLVRRMTATLRHRGPDEEGYFVEGPIALGHRRLTIIDLATGQHPVANATATLPAIP